ncbi:hypothetical protein [Poseidonocella sedimentorum]|nr:hypothetical protein [Poseidonocella sedimentorum]
MPDPRHDPRRVLDLFTRAQRHLSGFAPGPKGLILSEENIAGKMSGFGQERFFPMARERARFVARALPAPVTRVLFVLRRYDGFFASAYRLRASSRKVSSFDEMKPGILSMATGWPEVVTALRDGFPLAEITVLDYARRGESRELLRHLVPEAAELALEEPSRLENASPDDAMLEAAQATLGAESGENSSMNVEFTEAERALLDARYVADLERIGGMRGVTLLS